jgi:hypothetical protein
MRIEINLTGLKETRWYELAERFVAGGLMTAGAGLIAKEYGPVVGGIFLAFPAIFPASATLIEKHERGKKEEAGLHGSVRGRKAAGVDAAGAALGSLGLFTFALIVKRFLVGHSSWIVLVGATAIWLSVSLLLWQIRKRRWLKVLPALPSRHARSADSSRVDITRK